MLSVTKTDTFSGLLALKDEWETLLADCAHRNPFLTHAWVSTWWKHLGAGNEMCLLTVRDSSRVVLIAPLMKRQSRLHRRYAPIPIVALETIGNFSTRLDFIYRELRDDYLQALWSHLVHKEKWHLLRCHPLAEGSPTLRSLRHHIASTARQGIFTLAQSSPYVQIPETWNALEASLSSNFRKQLRKAARCGRAELEIIDRPEDLDRVLPEVFAVAQKAWAGTEGTAISSTPELRAFYTDMSHRAASEGWLFLSILRMEGKCVAFSYDIRYGSRIYSIKTAFDPEYSSVSPGNLLTALLLQHICDHLSQDIHEYEMLGEAEPYKLRWTSLQRNHIKTHIYHPSKAYARILSYAHSALMLHPNARKSVIAESNS